MKRPARVHFEDTERWQAGSTPCGVAGKLTRIQSAVTCGNCRRILKLPPLKRPTYNALRNERRSSKGLDALMHNAFVDYSGGLRDRIDALKMAIQAWDGPGSAADRYDEGQNLRTEAQALLDYLEREPKSEVN